MKSKIIDKSDIKSKTVQQTEDIIVHASNKIRESIIQLLELEDPQDDDLLTCNSFLLLFVNIYVRNFFNIIDLSNIPSKEITIGAFDELTKSFISNSKELFLHILNIN